MLKKFFLFQITAWEYVLKEKESDVELDMDYKFLLNIYFMAMKKSFSVHKGH